MRALRVSLLFSMSLWLTALAPLNLAATTASERAYASADATPSDPAIRPESPSPQRAAAPLPASLLTTICALLPPTFVGETAPDHDRLVDSTPLSSALGARAPPSLRA